MLLVKTRIAPSAIHGIGIFADEFIPKGTIIWEFTHGFDVYLTAEEIQTLPAPAQAQMLKYCHREVDNAKYVLCADDARFFNHSDEPNTVDLPGLEGPTIAARDIGIGEELTGDYWDFDADAAFKLRTERPTRPR
jgi:SET domain-containing protein